MAAYSTTVATTTTEVALVQSYFNTMDQGTLKFTVTLKTLATWGKTGRAYIEFPNYYRPDIG